MTIRFMPEKTKCGIWQKIIKSKYLLASTVKRYLGYFSLCSMLQRLTMSPWFNRTIIIWKYTQIVSNVIKVLHKARLRYTSHIIPNLSQIITSYFQLIFNTLYWILWHFSVLMDKYNLSVLTSRNKVHFCLKGTLYTGI